MASVRLRPGMYVGDTGEFGLRTLLWEVVANSVDEFLAGRARRIEIELGHDGSFTVTDDGGGIRPGVDMGQALTHFHSTPSFDGHVPHRHIHSISGVGLSVVSALASWCAFESVHPERTTAVAASRGVLSSAPLAPPSIARGTRVSFVPDAAIFPPLGKRLPGVREVLEGVCAIYRGLVFVLDGEELTHPRGVVELLEARLVEPIAEPFVFRGVSERATIDVAACFDARPPQRRIQTFANLQETFEHGAHLMGFHEAVTSVLEREPSLTTAPIPDFRKAYRAALVLVLAVDFEPIDYAGPTKGRVHTPELRGIVARALMEPLSRYFGGHGSAIVASFRQTATNAQ